MSSLLFEKEVDQSLLKAGLTIPVTAYEGIQEAVGVRLAKGQRTNITIFIDSQRYEAILTNVNLSGEYSNRTVFQIRYSEGSPICQKLKDVFSYVDLSSTDGKKPFIQVFSTDDKTLEFRVKSELKEAFYDYIGPVDSLSGYQRSYKLVFYKVFFTRLLTNQDTSCATISADFQQYYIQRKLAGLIPDVNADPVIANVEQSSTNQIYNLILRNPFNAISSHGFMVKENNGTEEFKLNPELDKQLSLEDYEEILRIVDNKLEKYYSTIDSGTARGGNMREIVEKMLNDYVPAKSETFAGHPLGAYFRYEIPQKLYNTGLIDSNDYLITGSVGQGNWAMVPWVCIFDRTITTTATKGVYIVYLLAKDGNTLYLTFNQGCTEIRNNHTKKETIKIMREKAADIASRIDARGFRVDEDINLGNGLTELGELYQKGTIFYKEYRKGAIPAEAELQDDLAKMMDIYREYANREDKPEEEINIQIEDESEEEMSVKEAVDLIKNYIAAKGFTYPDGLIENFYLSLKSKPFVILAGTSGTGKTKLVNLFAEAIGAEYYMVPVRPDWSDGSDLFGYNNLNGDFIEGPICKAFDVAISNPEKPVLLCLDEMNLARVEYYLSDFLSVIETRNRCENGNIKTTGIAQYKDGFPENLYVVGTVNMDETTFPFSRKVLDRANTIEFSFVDLTPPDEWALNAPAPINLGNSFLKTEYLLLSECSDQQESVNTYCAELQKLNQILQKANAHVGYRVRDEVVFYLLNNREAGLLPENEAMDNEIMQKILPRIQGSSASVKNMLCELFKVCAGDYEGQNTESDISSKMMKTAQKSDCKYKKSAEKIAFMVRRFEEDGFTSYWL